MCYSWRASLTWIRLLLTKVWEKFSRTSKLSGIRLRITQVNSAESYRRSYLLLSIGINSPSMTSLSFWTRAGQTWKRSKNWSRLRSRPKKPNLLQLIALSVTWIWRWKRQISRHSYWCRKRWRQWWKLIRSKQLSTSAALLIGRRSLSTGKQSSLAQ